MRLNRTALAFAASSCSFAFCIEETYRRSDCFSDHSGWDIHDTVYSRELLISNKDNGYRDILAKIDLTTYRRIPWEENVPFFLVSFLDPDTKEPLCACPRGTLNKALKQAGKHGWECVAGVEYEASRWQLA